MIDEILKKSMCEGCDALECNERKGRCDFYVAAERDMTELRDRMLEKLHNMTSCDALVERLKDAVR